MHCLHTGFKIVANNYDNNDDDGTSFAIITVVFRCIGDFHGDDDTDDDHGRK